MNGWIRIENRFINLENATEIDEWADSGGVEIWMSGGKNSRKSDIRLSGRDAETFREKLNLYFINVELD